MAYGEALQALADPTRRSVLEALRAGPLAVSEIAARVPVSRPAVSQHLKVLKDAGIVTETRAGTRHYFAIQPATVAEFTGTYFETMWKHVLRAYAQHVETEESKHAAQEPPCPPPPLAHRASRRSASRSWSRARPAAPSITSRATSRAGGRPPPTPCPRATAHRSRSTRVKVGRSTRPRRTAPATPGTLTRCDPGARLDFTWHPGRDPNLAQWVEVRFVPVAGGTRVELTQGGWDVLDERAPEARKGYLAGWTMIFNDRYAPYCQAS